MNVPLSLFVNNYCININFSYLNLLMNKQDGSIYKRYILKLLIVPYSTCKNVYLLQSVFDNQSNKTLRVLWGLRLEDTSSHYSRYSWWQMISRSTLSDFLDRTLLYTPETCSRLLVSKNITETIIISILYFRMIFYIKKTTQASKERTQTIRFTEQNIWNELSSTKKTYGQGRLHQSIVFEC